MFSKITEKVEDFKYKRLLSKIEKYEICEVTGERIPIATLADLYVHSETSSVYGYRMGEEEKVDALKKFTEMYPSIKEHSAKQMLHDFPALCTLFFIFERFGILKIELLDLILSFMVEENESLKIEKGIEFIKLYLYHTSNKISKNKFVVYTENNEGDNTILFVVASKDAIYKFHNLNSITKAITMIQRDTLGEF